MTPLRTSSARGTERSTPRAESNRTVRLAVEPFVRPRRLSNKVLAERVLRGQRGDCYRYAWREAMAYRDAGSPEPVLRVLHGEVATAAFGYVGHAWLERGGFAYDWQTLALGENPVPVAEFEALRRPRNVIPYAVNELVTASMANGTCGPFRRES